MESPMELASMMQRLNMMAVRNQNMIRDSVNFSRAGGSSDSLVRNKKAWLQ